MNNKINNIVINGIFISIIILQSVVPVIGYIPLGFINATIIQATVAIGSILLGSKKGAFLGLIFGITSMIKNTFSPNPSSFIFSPFVPDVLGNSGGIKSLIVCLIPRILVGIVASEIYLRLKKNKKTLFISGFFSSMVNTVLVLIMILILFNKEYLSIKNMEILSLPKLIMFIIFTQGIFEAILSGFICLSVVSILKKIR